MYIVKCNSFVLRFFGKQHQGNYHIAANWPSTLTITKILYSFLCLFYSHIYVTKCPCFWVSDFYVLTFFWGFETLASRATLLSNERLIVGWFRCLFPILQMFQNVDRRSRPSKSTIECNFNFFKWNFFFKNFEFLRYFWHENLKHVFMPLVQYNWSWKVTSTLTATLFLVNVDQ